MSVGVIVWVVEWVESKSHCSHNRVSTRSFFIGLVRAQGVQHGGDMCQYSDRNL